MKCARCSASLDDGVMVCSQCGAVVGMTYGRPSGAPAPAARKPAVPQPGAPRAGASKRLTERVKGILASPRAEWAAIAGEPASPMDIWSGYVIPLALIGPAAFAVAQVGFGTSFPMVGVVKAALVTGVAAALLIFAFALVQVAVLAWAIHAMAPKFQAKPDRLAALQVVAYSMTPVWLAGILYLVPPLAFLWVFAAFYAVVLSVFGIGTLMRCAPPQALGYALATLGVAFALWIVTGGIVTALMGFGPAMFD